jgi:hypothetical protein
VLRLLGWLLVIFLAISVIGAVVAVVKGLFWLAVLGLIFFALAAAFGWGRRDTRV